MQSRPATAKEILKAYPHNRRVGFETYTQEISDCRTENGVRHIKRASSKLREIDGKPFVMRHGELNELYATYYTTESGMEFVASATIRS